jgi:putative transposase
MRELAQKSKAETSKTRFNFSKKSTRLQKLYPISVQDLTSKEKDCSPYWNDALKGISSQLLSHTGIGSLDLASTSLNGLLRETEDISWLKMNYLPLQSRNLPETLPQLSRFLVPGSTVSEVTRLKKIKLYPTKYQRQALKQMMGVYRFVYNFVVHRVSTHKEFANYFSKRKDWNEILKTSHVFVFENCPAHTIYGAMRDACKDVTAHFTKLKNKTPSSLPRCRKRFQRTCFVLGNAVTSKGIYPHKWVKGLLKTTETLPNKPRDCRLLKEVNDYYLLIPEKVTSSLSENQGTICSIDPGIRTFATIFSPTLIGKIGSGGFKRIYHLARHADKLNSKISKREHGLKLMRARFAYKRILLRIRNLVDDLHYKTIASLFSKFDTVICPMGDFTSACKKGRRKINSKSVRSLLTYKFATFTDRLCHKAALLGKQVVLINESYTSKTANWSGEIITNLGGRTNIHSQGKIVDRDLNGALGIFLKALRDSACVSNNVVVSHV